MASIITSKIETNVNVIKQQLFEKNVLLVAVIKRRSLAEVNAIMQTGIVSIAENKVQDAQKTFSQLFSDTYFIQNIKKIQKHFIGHLQSNKVKQAVQLFDVIQTVDSLKIAELINREAQKINKIQQIMIQINIGCEQQKYGIDAKELFELYAQIQQLKNILIIGIMCIAPHIKLVGEQKVRDCFQEMKRLFDQLGKKADSHFSHLSMGMSDDYLIAIEEGSTMVRIGRKLFE